MISGVVVLFAGVGLIIVLAGIFCRGGKSKK